MSIVAATLSSGEQVGLGKLHLQLLNVIFLVDDAVRCHRFRGLARSCTQHRLVELSNCRSVRRQRMVNLVTYNRHACRPHCSRQCLGGSRAVVGVLVPAPRLATRRNHQLQHVQCPGFVRLRGAKSKASRGVSQLSSHADLQISLLEQWKVLAPTSSGASF